jgi:hypothetical protein
MKLTTTDPAPWAGFCGLAFVVVAGTASAQAQDPFANTPPMQAAPSAQPPVIQPLPEPQAPAPQPPPVLQAPPFPQPPSAVAPLPPPPLPLAGPEAPAKEPSGLKFLAFVDANYGFQTQAAGSPSAIHRAYDFNAPGYNEQGAFAPTANNGFALSFAGIDASYDGGELGATISLRAGPSVPVFYAANTSPLGIENITQAYATWTPVPELSFDFGQFATIYGAEVAESWRNPNYTRGALYYAMQPFWHTGLRATVSPNDQISITGMIVNGVNSAIDTNESPSLGLQFSVTPTEAFSASLGWLTALEPSSDGSNFNNFLDLVVALNVDRFTATFNADLSINKSRTFDEGRIHQVYGTPVFWGLSLAGAYQATDLFGLALRGEVLSDVDNILYRAPTTLINGAETIVFPGTTATNVMTITGTLDFKPVRGNSNLVIRWDNRLETSNRDIFSNRSENPTGVWFGSILGVVVSTEN